MKKTIIDETKDKINVILEKNNRELSTREMMLREAEAKAAEAEIKSNEAVAAGDDAAYADAQQILFKAKLDIEMNKKRIDFLKKQQLITVDECRAIENSINEYLEKEEAADGADFIKLLSAARSIARKWEARTDEANALFNTLELDACKINTNLPTKHESYALPGRVRKLCTDGYIRSLTGEPPCYPHQVKL